MVWKTVAGDLSFCSFFLLCQTRKDIRFNHKSFRNRRKWCEKWLQESCVFGGFFSCGGWENNRGRSSIFFARGLTDSFFADSTDNFTTSLYSWRRDAFPVAQKERERGENKFNRGQSCTFSSLYDTPVKPKPNQGVSKENLAGGPLVAHPERTNPSKNQYNNELVYHRGMRKCEQRKANQWPIQKHQSLANAIFLTFYALILILFKFFCGYFDTF